MSTNFFIERVVHGQAVNSEHIGKRSAGWAFTFQGQNHRTMQAWVQRVSGMGAQEQVVDEYGRPYTFVEFFAAVWGTREPFNGQEPQVKPEDGTRNWVDEGFSFSRYDFS